MAYKTVYVSGVGSTGAPSLVETTAERYHSLQIGVAIVLHTDGRSDRA